MNDITADNVSDLAAHRSASRAARPRPSDDVCGLGAVLPAGGRAAAFQDCLSRLASGVAIAACNTADGPKGLLVNSLTGLSPQPPRILFCVRKVEPSHPALLAAETVSLSILASDQQAEADRFAGAGPGRFGDAWLLKYDVPPRLTGALAGLEGRVRTRIDAGSHTIFILDVLSAETRPGAPLVYFEHSFLGPGAN